MNKEMVEIFKLLEKYKLSVLDNRRILDLLLDLSINKKEMLEK